MISEGDIASEMGKDFSLDVLPKHLGGHSKMYGPHKEEELPSLPGDTLPKAVSYRGGGASSAKDTAAMNGSTPIDMDRDLRQRTREAINTLSPDHFSGL